MATFTKSRRCTTEHELSWAATFLKVTNFSANKKHSSGHLSSRSLLFCQFIPFADFSSILIFPSSGNLLRPMIGFSPIELVWGLSQPRKLVSLGSFR